MKIFHVGFGTLTLFVTLIISASSAFAQSHNAKTDRHRIQYPTDGVVPRGYALSAWAHMAATDYDMAMFHVGAQAGLTGEAAHRLVTDLHSELAAEKSDAEARIACEGINPRLTEDEVYRALDLIPDVRAVVYEKYYLVAQADLDSEQLAALESMIRNMKMSVNIYHAHKYFSDAAPYMARQRLNSLCEARSM